MDLSRPLILLSARTTMSVLFLLPLLLAHRPTNVQPRRSILRRMPYYIGKRDSSLPLRASKYPAPSDSLPGQPDDTLPHLYRYQPQRPTSLDLADLSTWYSRHFMKNVNDYPGTYSSGRSENGRGKLFNSESGKRFLDVALKPPVERAGNGEWNLANILYKSIVNSYIRDESEDSAFVKRLAANVEADSSYPELYRTLVSAVEDRPTEMHGLVHVRGGSEDTDGADGMFPANERYGSYKGISRLNRFAQNSAADVDHDNDDESMSSSDLTSSAVHVARKKFSRYAFNSMLNDDENEADDEGGDEVSNSYDNSDDADSTSRLYVTEDESEDEW